MASTVRRKSLYHNSVWFFNWNRQQLGLLTKSVLQYLTKPNMEVFAMFRKICKEVKKRSGGKQIPVGGTEWCMKQTKPRTFPFHFVIILTQTQVLVDGIGFGSLSVVYLSSVISRLSSPCLDWEWYYATTNGGYTCTVSCVDWVPRNFVSMQCTL